MPKPHFAFAPTVFVIFGVTGDLAEKKLIPALFDLYIKGFLPTTFRIVGFSRRGLSREEFREFIRAAIHRKKKRVPLRALQKFIETASYTQGIFDISETYKNLSRDLGALDDGIGQCTNKLFYLAVPPHLYEPIFEQLAGSGLTIPCSDELGWTRVLVEKPFGRNQKTADALERILGKLFKEEQIFRIDHYLAKETVQNILAFRFSNVLFEPTWNKEYIEKVEIKLFEKGGLGGRGDFYDGVGALRDVGQNHLLQMLALIAMENPQVFDGSHIRAERSRVLGALSLSASAEIVRGQFEGYRGEAGVARDSGTETYFRFAASINNQRWRGVPFILESGKEMPETKTEIIVHFKKGEHKNVLTFRVQPDEGIGIEFWAKKPGFEFMLEPRQLSFLYKDSPDFKNLPDAYERVLFDCIRGDQTLFTSTEEVLASWRFIESVLARWDHTKLVSYPKGAILKSS